MIARTDDYNSTINFPKILFLSFFDRPRSTRPFFSFFSPFSPSSTLSLSRGKIYSLLSPIARRFCFPGRSSKGKKVSTLDRCAAYRFFFIRPLFFLLFSAVQKKKGEEKKRKGSKTTSRCGQCFVRISLLFYSFIPREITLIISHRFLEWLLEEM